MRAKLVVGNWKMNGGLRANAALLEGLVAGWRGVPGRSMAVCVPFPYLPQAQAALTGSAIAWGAQNVSEHRAGAFTGEVAASMLVDFGCRYAIVGHSERRQLYSETDDVVGARTAAALAGGITPIVCVGETLAERRAGETEQVVMRQLEAMLSAVGEGVASIVLAYEPVWAIGTGLTATPEQAQAVHERLRERLAAAGAADVPVLYGGSVKGDNAAALFGMPDIDGGLIGGASLKVDEFLAIGHV